MHQIDLRKKRLTIFKFPAQYIQRVSRNFQKLYENIVKLQGYAIVGLTNFSDASSVRRGLK